MADILIRGMKMPENCGECAFLRRLEKPILYISPFLCCINGLEVIKQEKNRYCPLFPLPEGHGDLIDRDNVLLDIDCTGTNKFGMLDEDIRAFLRRYTPIVPAEGGGEDG